MMKKIFIGLGVFLVLFILLMVWYKNVFSMNVVKTYEINDKSMPQKVLIASQGSEYKNGVVDGVIDHLKGKSIYIKVIDVSSLDEVSPDEWNALIILHNWEVWEPEINSEKFLSENYAPNKMFVISTSGAGDMKLEGVDAITGASIIEEIPDHIEIITAWLDKLLSE